MEQSELFYKAKLHTGHYNSTVSNR